MFDMNVIFIDGPYKDRSAKITLDNIPVRCGTVHVEGEAYTLIDGPCMQAILLSGGEYLPNVAVTAKYLGKSPKSKRASSKDTSK